MGYETSNIDPGTSPTTPVAVDTVSGQQIQIIKIDVGGDGLSAPLSSSNPLPVSAASLPLPTGAATETTLAALSTKIPASPAAEHTTAGSPNAVRLTDGTSFYKSTTPSDTQPVSAASLPLPAGAATSAAQTTGNTSLSNIDTKIPSLGQTTMAGSQPVTIASNQSSIPVSGTFWQATQPVSVASIPSHAVTNAGTFAVQQTASIPAGTNTIGNVGSTTGVAVPTTAQYIAGNIGGNLSGINAIGSTDALSGQTGLVTVSENMLFNGSTFDRQRSSGPTGTAAVAGTFTEQPGLSAAALNADLVPSTDVSAYKWISVQVTAVGVGTISWQGSNDNTNFVNVILQNAGSSTGIGSQTVSAVGIYTGPLQYRYFRARLTAYTSGTFTGAAQLYTQQATFANTGVIATQQGTWTVGSNSATGATIPANAYYMGYSVGGFLNGMTGTNGADANGTGGGLFVASKNYVFNGTNDDRMRAMSPTLSTGNVGIQAVGLTATDGANIRELSPMSALGDGGNGQRTLSMGTTLFNGTTWDRQRSGGVLGMAGVVNQASPSGGYTPGKLISAATTNATSVKASAGTMGYITASNVNASPRYLKLYNKASAPTVGSDVPVHTFIIPGNTTGAGTNIPVPGAGINFSTGIAFALTVEATDAGSTGVALSELVINYGWA